VKFNSNTASYYSTTVTPTTRGTILRRFFIALITFSLMIDFALAEDSDLELGKQLMYCSILKMKLARAGGKSETGEAEYKKAYDLMIVSTADLIPVDQLNSEFANVQSQFRQDIALKVEEQKTTPDAVELFLANKYRECQKLQAERGLEAYKRGVGKMTKESSSPK
jgi:hypothetical protein